MESIERVKKIRIILLVIACIACFVGASKSRAAEKKAATDVSKIKVQIVDKECYHKAAESEYRSGYYYVDLTYKITNRTKTTWSYLNITTYVYDKDGKSLGTITSEFGSTYGTSDLKLKAGGTVTQSSSFKSNQPDDFFATMYVSDLSELVFESEVTYGRHK